MKRGMVTVAVMVVITLLVVGCGSSKPAAPTKPTRDISTPSKALLGHWSGLQSNGWSSTKYSPGDLYISEKQVTLVDSEHPQPKVSDYMIVLENNQLDNDYNSRGYSMSLEVKYILAGSGTDIVWSDTWTLLFNKDATEMTYFNQQLFVYVDDKQSP